MKTIGIFIVMLLFSSQLIGQDKSQLNEMIISSINSYIVNNNDLVIRGYSSMDTSSYYICMDGLPMHFPFDSVQNAFFFSLNNVVGLPSSFKKKLNKGIKTLFIGIRLINNKLIISVAGRGVKLTKKNHVEILMGDWGIFTYEYSCEKQDWFLLDTKFGGI